MLVDLRAQYARIKDDVDRRIKAVLEHGQYILGPEVRELEERLAARTGVKHCLAVASGTDALLMPLMALGVGPGDEVITSPFTFVATAEVIRLVGATPVYGDIDPQTYNLDPKGLEALITKRTRAILPVSLFGQCADFDAINAIAARHKLPVIEDAAQSLGATWRGKQSGSLTTLSGTSFYPSKPLGGYGDGGAVFTDDDALAGALREIRVHGQSSTYRYARVGLNGRLDSIQCAVLLAKLAVFPAELDRRARVAARYDRLLAGVVQTPLVRPPAASIHAQYTIEVDDRDGVRARLKDAGVTTAVYYPSTLNHEGPYRDEGARVPRAERAATRVLSLPMHAYLEEAEQDRIVEAMRRAVPTSSGRSPAPAGPRP
ncbi:MAG: DegT/DnrJ/EryC1/StrS family aminotransferase [Gammaproteobacteria bacterium]